MPTQARATYGDSRSPIHNGEGFQRELGQSYTPKLLKIRTYPSKFPEEAEEPTERTNRIDFGC